MSKIKQAMETKAELSMMGKFVEAGNDEEVRFITSYVIGAVVPGNFSEDFDVFSCIRRFNNLNTVTHIGCFTVCGMPTITYCVDPMDGETPYLFTEDYGTGSPCSFCYVLNLEAHEMCSEFGDCFFEKKPDGYFHRVS